MTDVRDFDLERIGPNFLADPYPTLRALREAAPVHRMADGSVLLTRGRGLDDRPDGARLRRGLAWLRRRSCRTTAAG